MLNEQPPKESNFRTVLEFLARKKGSLTSTFNDFVCMAACALAAQTREEEYLNIAGQYTREELDEFAKAMGYLINEMQDHRFTDILGVYFAEVQSKFSRDAGGEFYTPQEVEKVMARMSVNAPEIIERGRPFTICDPASGSGGLILSLAEEFAEANAVDLMRVTCQDISKAGCDMAYINMTLWGIPARIIWGDTLKGTENKRWQNIHWHRVGEPLREREKLMMSLLQVESQTASDETSVTTVEQLAEEPAINSSRNSVGQQEWLFE